jgi:hypothetical protein
MSNHVARVVLVALALLAFMALAAPYTWPA